MNKLLVILGPTSTGKTDLALLLAKKFNGELVSYDSRQVYQGLDIGTGKLPNEERKIENGEIKKVDGFWEIEGIKTWMYDVATPKKQYTVADYVQEATKIIKDILHRNKLAIIVGGTGFYLKALLEGLPHLAIPVDQELRRQLQILSKGQLQEKLQQLSAKKWQSLNGSDRQNPRRLIRAIELALVKPKKNRIKIYDLRFKNILKIGLTTNRQALYQRINERVISRINQGMIEEAKCLHSKGLSFTRMRELGLEYGVLADYLECKIADKEELIQVLQGKIHGYARRQITWFKKEKDINWFDINDKNCAEQVENFITKWYDNSIID